MNTIHPCQKCQSKMREGFITDHTYGGDFFGYWHEGIPKKSFWDGGLKTDPEHRGLPIAGLRSSNCGFLELYSGNNFKPK